MNSAALRARADEIIAAMPEDGRPDGDRVHQAIVRAGSELAAMSNGQPPGGVDAAPFALTLDDFIACDDDAPAALIGDDEDSLLPACGLLLMVAKGGKGKTTLSIDQALHLASGVPWLGFKVARSLRVLFIENEGPREPFRRKMERKREGWPHPITGGIFIYTENWGDAKLNEEAFVKRLNEFVAANEIDLVIGDPLDTLGMDGVGSPEDTRNMIELFKRAGLFSKVAWQVLGHSRKESVADAVDEASGAWGGKPDTLLTLEKQKGNRAKLSFPKVRWSRRGERSAYILSFEPESESFEVVKEEINEERDYASEIEEHLAEHPYRTAKEIAGDIQASVDSVKAALEGSDPRFRSRTKEAAKEVGRHPTATVWEVTSPSEVTKSPTAPQGELDAELTADFSLKEVSSPQPAPPPAAELTPPEEPPTSPPAREVGNG